MSRGLVALLLVPCVLFAEDKKDGPRVTAIAPVEIVPGVNVSLKIRGLKLKDASEVRFSDSAVTAEVKEK